MGGEVIGVIGVVVDELVVGSVEVVAVGGSLAAVEVVEGLGIVGVVHIVLRLHLLLQKIRAQKRKEKENGGADGKAVINRQVEGP